MLAFKKTDSQSIFCVTGAIWLFRIILAGIETPVYVRALNTDAVAFLQGAREKSRPKRKMAGMPALC
jgi:hypothetical protein